jgi:dienelactone hydrolase
MWLILTAGCGPEVPPRQRPPTATTPAPTPTAPDPPACEPPPEGPFDRAWDLSAWLVAHPDRRPVRTTRQSGDPEPVALGARDAAAEVADWRAAWDEVVGPIPDTCVPLDPRDEPLDLSAEERAGLHPGYTLSRVSYRGDHGERIPALLLVPEGLTGPVPGVLAMHQAQPACGKKEPAGVCIEGAANLDFARDLAERGLVVLAPDSVGYGDRAVHSWETGLEYADAAPLLSRFPEATLMGLRIADVRRGIDLLASLPEVDAARLGMVGHSNGGIETLFSAAWEPRIRCAVSNAGPNLLRRETLGWDGLDPGIARWAGWAYVPPLAFLPREELAVEMHQLAAMIAPRGLYLALVADDSIAPAFDRVPWTFAATDEAFDRLGGDFVGHEITSGLTPECRAEWGAPLCLSAGYDACGGDGGCLAAYASVGIDEACVTATGNSLTCAWQRWWTECRVAEGLDEAACTARFAGAGVTEACVEASFQAGWRRDHGWYPEVEDEAWPWLLACLDAE